MHKILIIVGIEIIIKIMIVIWSSSSCSQDDDMKIIIAGIKIMFIMIVIRSSSSCLQDDDDDVVISLCSRDPQAVKVSF